MFEELLVPVDLGDQGRAPLDVAASLVREGGGRLTLLHVIEAIEHVPYEEMEDFYERLQAQASRTLGEWESQLRDGGVEARWEVVVGKRGREIVRRAREIEADLIVLGSHALDPEHPGERVGTLSHQVAVLAPCSVLLVR